MVIMLFQYLVIELLMHVGNYWFLFSNLRSADKFLKFHVNAT